MSVKKMGSKLAQGVRQVMEQSNKSETVENKVAHRVTAQVVPAEIVSKQGTVTVKNKTTIRDRDADYEIQHPERVWPD